MRIHYAVAHTMLYYVSQTRGGIAWFRERQQTVFAKHMNQKIAPLIAICAIASGLTAARAAEGFTAYNLNLAFTNAEASYWSVNGAPETTGTTFITVTPSNTSVQTDNSGQISGNGLLTVTYNTAQVPYSTFSVSYSGQITAPAGSPPTATIF